VKIAFTCGLKETGIFLKGFDAGDSQGRANFTVDDATDFFLPSGDTPAGSARLLAPHTL